MVYPQGFQEKALMLSMSLDHDNFTASNGWLESWQKRFGMKLASLCGEAAEVPQDVVEDWTKRLPAITDEYADETGLFFPYAAESSNGRARRSAKRNQDVKGADHRASRLFRGWGEAEAAGDREGRKA